MHNLTYISLSKCDFKDSQKFQFQKNTVYICNYIIYIYYLVVTVSTGLTILVVKNKKMAAIWISYQFNQGLVFLKHPNFYRRKLLF